jgi:Rrf2 family protein
MTSGIVCLVVQPAARAAISRIQKTCPEFLTAAVGNLIPTWVRIVPKRQGRRVYCHTTPREKKAIPKRGFRSEAKVFKEYRMQLSTKGRYAVMAMIDVARAGEERPMPLAVIAQRQDISLAYLEQLFMKLRRNGLVRSVRGPGGGYVLARPPRDVRIGEIMAAVDEPIKMTRCAGEGADGCIALRRCATHNLWRALGDHIGEFLDRTTLRDVLDGQYAAHPVETNETVEFRPAEAAS